MWTPFFFVTVTSLPLTLTNSNQGIAWGLSRPEDASSAPQDSQGHDIVFEYKFSSISKWRKWERKFVLWLKAWNPKASEWKLKAVEKTGITDQAFFKEFKHACLTRTLGKSPPISKLLEKLREAYS